MITPTLRFAGVQARTNANLAQLDPGDQVVLARTQLEDGIVTSNVSEIVTVLDVTGHDYDTFNGVRVPIEKEIQAMYPGQKVMLRDRVDVLTFLREDGREGKVLIGDIQVNVPGQSQPDVIATHELDVAGQPVITKGDIPTQPVASIINVLSPKTTEGVLRGWGNFVDAHWGSNVPSF